MSVLANPSEQQGLWVLQSHSGVQLQDAGRFGAAGAGLTQGGAVDLTAARIANALAETYLENQASVRADARGRSVDGATGRPGQGRGPGSAAPAAPSYRGAKGRGAMKSAWTDKHSSRPRVGRWTCHYRSG